MMRVILPTYTFYGIAAFACVAVAIGLALAWVYDRGRRS